MHFVKCRHCFHEEYGFKTTAAKGDSLKLKRLKWILNNSCTSVTHRIPRNVAQWACGTILPQNHVDWVLLCQDLDHGSCNSLCRAPPLLLLHLKTWWCWSCSLTNRIYFPLFITIFLSLEPGSMSWANTLDWLSVSNTPKLKWCCKSKYLVFSASVTSSFYPHL